MSDAEGGSDAGSRSSGDRRGPFGDVPVWRYLRLGAIGLLALLAVVATLQLYLNAQRAIGRWVAAEYGSAFLAAFNLVVLLLALAGLAAIARANRS